MQYADNPDELNIRNGHPDAVTIRGQRIKVRKLMYRPVRWPLALDKPIHWIQSVTPWGDGDWTDVPCVHVGLIVEEE